MSKKHRKSAVWKALFDTNYGVYDYLRKNEFIASDDDFAEIVVMSTINDWKAWRMGAFAYSPKLPAKVRKKYVQSCTMKLPAKVRKKYVQLNILYHAIGLDRFDESRVTDGKYLVYRNRFFSQGSQLEQLKILEKLGYLTREKLPKWFFKVTEKGFELLTDITGLKFEEEK